MNKLTQIKVAILTESGFEQVELTKPKDVLEFEGFTVHVISPHPGKVKAWNFTDWGIDVKVDVALADANPADYAALVLPGGVLNPDKLRQNELAVSFVKIFMESGKPVAAICHGIQILTAANVVKGRKLTAYPAVGPEVTLAGGNFQAIPADGVIVDGNLVTSPAWPAHPGFIREFLKVMGAKIEI